MAKPINHDMLSEVSTTGWEGAKGAAKGVLAIPAAGGIAGAAIGLGAALLLGSGLGAALAVVAVGAAVGAVGAGIVGAPVMGIMAAIGAAFGLNRGSNNVAKEKVAFREKIQEQEFGQVEQMAAAQNQGLQQGYQVGFQEGQAYAVNRIQQEIQAQASSEQQLPADGFAAKIKAQREQAAAMGQQMGGKA